MFMCVLRSMLDLDAFLLYTWSKMEARLGSLADGTPAQESIQTRSRSLFVRNQHCFLNRVEFCQCAHLDDELLLPTLGFADVNKANARSKGQLDDPVTLFAIPTGSVVWHLGACRERNRRFGCRACSWCMLENIHSSNCCLAVSLRRLVVVLRLLARVDLGGVALHSSSACSNLSVRLSHGMRAHRREDSHT